MENTNINLQLAISLFSHLTEDEKKEVIALIESLLSHE